MYHVTAGGMCRRGRGQRGVTLVEIAILLPLFLAVGLAIFTGGTTYYRKIAVVEAVREGSRFGASLPLGSGAGATTEWEEAVRGRVVEASGGELAPTDVCVALVFPTGGNACNVGDPPGAANESAVRLVKVYASRPGSIEFFFFELNPTLSARLAARYERDTG
jgi:hypothetical protein